MNLNSVIKFVSKSFHDGDKNSVFPFCESVMLEFWEQSPKAFFLQKPRETNSLQFTMVSKEFTFWTEKLFWLFQRSRSEKQSTFFYTYKYKIIFVYFHIYSYLEQHLFFQHAQNGYPIKTWTQQWREQFPCLQESFGILAPVIEEKQFVMNAELLFSFHM